MSRYADRRKEELYDELEYRYTTFMEETEGYTFLDWLQILMEVVTDLIINKKD